MNTKFSLNLFLLIKLYKLSYFEAARSLTNRSILCVCEDLANKADAKRACLGNFPTTKRTNLNFEFKLYTLPTPLTHLVNGVVECSTTHAHLHAHIEWWRVGNHI